MKITRLYTGKDQKSYFEEIELKFGGDGGFSLRATGHRSRPSSGAAAPVSHHNGRVMGD